MKGQMKDFLKELQGKKLKKMTKKELVEHIYIYLPDILTWYFKKSFKEQNTLTELYSVMKEEKFQEALCKMVKKRKDDYPEINNTLTILIVDFIEKNVNSEEENVSLSIYFDIIDKLLKKPVSKIADKTGFSKDVVNELLVICPEPNFKEMPPHIFVQKLLKKIYLLSADKDSEFASQGEKELKKLIKAVIGKSNMDALLLTLLIERKNTIERFNENQLNVWNKLTNILLKEMDKMDKDDLENLIDKYCSFRLKAKDSDSARRLTLTQVNEEDYKTISKVVNRMNKKDKYSKVL